MAPVAPKHKSKKQKKLKPPQELLSDVDVDGDDPDTLITELNAREYSFIDNMDTRESDGESASATSAPANSKEAPTASKHSSRRTQGKASSSTRSKSSTITANAANSSPKPTEEVANEDNNESPSIVDITDDEQGAASIRQLPQRSSASHTITSATAQSAPSSTVTRNITGAVTDPSTGAISKTKAATKHFDSGYAFPEQQSSRSWYDATEEAADSREFAHRSSSTLTSARPEPTRRVQFAPSQTLEYVPAPKQRAPPDERFASHRDATKHDRRTIYDDPPRLVVDANVRALHGESAYFDGSEYRKPDKRTIFIEGLQRMYQNTLQPHFFLLPKETIEHHIAAVEKYWDKFLAAHNELYYQCETATEIEPHRICHRNTQRLYDDLTNRLLQQLSKLNAEERLAARHQRSPHASESNITQEIKLEKIRIPPFDGNYQKWPQFKRIFETYFHNTNTSNTAKMVHLLGHLVENSEPRNLINGLDPSGDNYPIAWQTICDAYDDERRILDTMITKFIDIPQVQHPTRAALMDLVTKTKNLIEPMATYGISTETWGVWLVPILVRKLDKASRSEWCMERPRRVRPAVQPLLLFISKRAEGVDDLPQTPVQYRVGQQQSHNNHQKQGAKANSNATSGTSGRSSHPPKKTKCPDPLCAPNNDHQMFSCPRFKSLDLEQRRQKVRALGVCELCLRKGHESSKCTMKACFECDERHNSWLCAKKVRVASAVAPPAPLTAFVASVSAVGTTDHTVAHAPLLATAIIAVTDKCGQTHTLRALCDQGSQVNMITTAAHQLIGVDKTRNHLTVSGVGGKETKSVGQAVVTFKSRFNSSKQFHMTAMVLPHITNRLPSTRLVTTDWKHLDGLPLADPKYNIPDDIDVVIGAETYASLVKHGVVKGAPDQPIAQCTRIGWIVYGSTHASSRYLHTLHTVAERAREPQIEQLLIRFWEVEEVPSFTIRSAEEQLCEDIFTANTVRDATGRYTVRIPIKADAPELGESRSIAVRRLFQMEARFAKKPELKQQYADFMAEYLRLGHMVEAPPLPKGAAHYYIPHHAAGTKKFRVVFDGSSKTSNGIAFNDIQMIGEKLQPDLTSITMRFRTHRVALTADIKKMYRQILVCPDQRDFQRIVWRENEKQPIRDYQLITQTYGLRSAPHNCVRALVQCANDHESEHPLAATVIRRDFYIDDMLSGADSANDAEFLYNEMNTTLGRMGAELAKWTTNSEELRSRLECVGAVQPVAIDKDEADSTVLGLRWNPSSDTFKYKVLLPKQNEKITKRRIVSNVAKLYDPNGYLSPVVITAKVLIQKLWQSECTWDSKVPKELATEYTSFMAELLQLDKLSIPRWIGTSPKTHSELHAFCDASNIAYGCAFYIKTVDPVNGTTVRLVASKTRVAPIKRMTIPRLELCGAHLLAKMLNEIRQVHDILPQNCHLWTDSMIVLYWLHKMPSSAKIYVANRIAETAEWTKSCTWRHVPTKDNPADMASRGVSVGALTNSKLWWEGPSWLAESAEKWPKNDLQLTEEQSKAIAVENSPPVVLISRKPESFLENENGDILLQASRLHRLVRVTAWIARFVHNARDPSNRKSGPLTAEEYIAAELMWVRHEQKQHFAEEMNCPDQNGALLIPKSSKLFGLKPFIKNGILRGQGRLENSTLPFNSTHPIVLSAESRLTLLIVRSAHLATLHGGTQLTMHYVRQKYWVPRLRRLTRSIIHQCVICVRQNAISMQQQMAALPKVRITPGRPFQKCGVDYCGPFYIKARGGRCKIITKAYVAVFVCMASRAVHLELVSDLTTDAFLAALSRLSSRRGRVHELYSDNGTTFHGADKDIAAAVDSWKKMPLNTMFQALYIKWTFIPPAAAHQGGLWEAAVKSTKHHLRRVVGDQQLTFEELYTVLTQIEACLNSRPITRATDDNTDNLALTPSHFWALEPIVTPMAQDHTDVPINRLKRWKLLQRFVQDFWRRWKDEYLDQLFARTKWQSEQPNAAVDDVVLVRSENTPPQQWPMGRITNVYPGNDGLVRSVDVLYGGHEYRRPITKLVPLPTTDQE